MQQEKKKESSIKTSKKVVTTRNIAYCHWSLKFPSEGG